jgi:polyferredoxin
MRCTSAPAMKRAKIITAPVAPVTFVRLISRAATAAGAPGMTTMSSAATQLDQWLHQQSRRCGANCAAVVQWSMAASKHPGGAGRRRPATALRRKEPSWTALLIRVAIAIALFNIVAGLLVWYFLFSPRKH